MVRYHFSSNKNDEKDWLVSSTEPFCFEDSLLTNQLGVSRAIADAALANNDPLSDKLW